MKNIILTLCAIFTFSLAAAQTDTKTKQQTKVEKKQAADANKARSADVNQNNSGNSPTTTSLTSDNMGVVNPTDSPEHGATGRNNSRQAEVTRPRDTVRTATPATNNTGSGTVTPGTNNNTNSTTRPKGQ